MANVNKVFLVGRLTRDPEIRYTPAGAAVSDVSVAVNRNWTDSSGEKREEVCFVDVTVWGKQAEALVQYMKKGREVHVEGHLRLDQWEDQNTGQKRQKLRVVSERVQFLGGKREDSGGGDGPAEEEKANEPF